LVIDTQPAARARSAHPLLLFVAVLAILFGAAFLAGRAGVFSSGAPSLIQSINDPARRLEATASFSDQVADAIANGHPTIPGPREERACPGPYIARASTLIGALTPQEVSRAFRDANHRFAAGGFRVLPPPSPGRPPSVSARTRRGILIAVSQLSGADLSAVQVTVVVPGPGTTTPPTSAVSNPATAAASITGP
jgi:hypothetical protein